MKIMKCIICHGEEIEVMEVKEEIKAGLNIIYVPIKIPVCKTCGERYYDRKTMQYLEKIQEKLNKQDKNQTK